MQDLETPKRQYVFHKSMDEISRMKSMAGRIGGKIGGRIGGKIGGKISHGGGRPPSRPSERYRPIKIAESSWATFSACAKHDGKTRLQFLYDLALSLKSDPRYAHLFAETASQPQTI